MDCIFCKIAAGEIPSKIVYQDEQVVVFPDIHPVTPVHLLIIPKKHIESVNTIPESDSNLVSHMVKVAAQVAKKEGIAETGFRLVINTGEFGGQIIQHLHMHLLGGRRLSGKFAG